MGERREQRAEQRGEPALSRPRLSYSFPDTHKVHRFLFLLWCQDCTILVLTHSNYLIPVAIILPFSLWFLMYLTILYAGVLVFLVKEN